MRAEQKKRGSKGRNMWGGMGAQKILQIFSKRPGIKKKTDAGSVRSKTSKREKGGERREMVGLAWKDREEIKGEKGDRANQPPRKGKEVLVGKKWRGVVAER